MSTIDVKASTLAVSGQSVVLETTSDVIAVSAGAGSVKGMDVRVRSPGSAPVGIESAATGTLGVKPSPLVVAGQSVGVIKISDIIAVNAGAGSVKGMNVAVR